MNKQWTNNNYWFIDSYSTSNTLGILKFIRPGFSGLWQGTPALKF